MRLSKLAKDLKEAGIPAVVKYGINSKKVYVRNLEFSRIRGEHTTYIFESNEMTMFPVTDYILNDDGSITLTIIKDGKYVSRTFWSPMRVVPKNDAKIRGVLLGCMDCFYRKRQIAAGKEVKDCDCPKMRRETKEA